VLGLYPRLRAFSKESLHSFVAEGLNHLDQMLV
jgi:hypothetical protein